MTDDSDKVLETVISIVVKQTKNSVAIGPDTALQADTNLSSLQLMEMVLEIEEDFDISFPLNRLPDIETVRDLADEVQKALGA